MVTTNYPYIIPEGVVWSARTGRLMTVAEAAAELEAQAGGGGGGGAPSGATMGLEQYFADGQNLPAGWWALTAVGSTPERLDQFGTWDTMGTIGGRVGLGLFRSDGSIVIDASAMVPGGGIWARPVTFT